MSGVDEGAVVIPLDVGDLVLAHQGAHPLQDEVVCRGVTEVEHVLVARSHTRTVLGLEPVSYTHLRAHETVLDLVCRLLLEKKKTSRIYDGDDSRRSNI